MFNRELNRKIRELESDLKELKKHICCLRGFHDWIVAQGLTIRCRHCHKAADAMPNENNTRPGDR